MAASLSLGLSVPTGRSVSGDIAPTGFDAELFYSNQETVTALQVDKHVVAAIRYAGLKFLWIECPNNLTVETNATDHAGGDSIAVTGGDPLVWSSDMPWANPLTADVTDFYLTNGENTVIPIGGIKIWAGYDAAP